jgi:hypothetical protein
MYRSICFALLLLPGITFGQEAKPDRSAEPRLKQLFDAMGKLKSLQARIDRFSRDDPKTGWSPEGPIELAYSQTSKFRVSTTGGWGDQADYLSDGKTFLYDPHDIPSGIVLKDAKQTIYECDSALAQRGGASTPLYYFLAGTKGFDELVAKEGEIVSLPLQNGEEGIRFRSTKIGTVKAFFDAKDKRMLVSRIEFDDLENKKEQAKMWAEWGAEEPIDPLDVHRITYFSIGKGVSPRLFNASPPNGLKVEDQREKKKS